MTPKNIVLELQEDVVKAVTLADNSAHEVSRRDGSMSILLVCLNKQVAHLQEMLDKAHRVQSRVRDLVNASKPTR